MVTIIGHISCDTIINAQGDRRKIPGGAGYTGALGASLVSSDVGLVSRVGHDYNMQLLTQMGIDISGVHQIENDLTTQFVLTYRYEDPLQRDFEAHFNVGSGINPYDIPDFYIRDSTHIHIATMPPEQQRAFIEFIRQQNPNIHLSLDTIEHFLLHTPSLVFENMRMCDTVFADRREVQHIPQDITDTKELIIKLGREGAKYQQGGTIIPVTTRPIDFVVDKTGSGDVLAGVYLAYRATGKDPEYSLQEGCRLATESIQQFGVEHLRNLRRKAGPEFE